MPERKPLTELRNQCLPRRKVKQTFGKKKGQTLRARDADRQLFGTDEKENEIEIEEQMARLRVGSPVPAGVSRAVPILSQEDAAAVVPLLSLVGGEVDFFERVGEELDKGFSVEKIGDGAFSHVFKLNGRMPNSPSSSSSTHAGSGIIKVIPFATPSFPDAETSVISVINEIKILTALKPIHGFARYRGARIVMGNFPKSFHTACKNFDHAKGKPHEDFAYEDFRMHAVLDMDDAGKEIDLIRQPTAFQIYDIVWMTTANLALAEQEIEFEHRDLHVSNICYTSFKSDDRIDVDRRLVEEMKDEPSHKLGLSGLKLTIIDYTLSRATTNKNKNEVVWEDSCMGRLYRPDETYEEKLQFDTYDAITEYVEKDALKAKMESEMAGVVPSDGDEFSSSELRRFTPRTNIFWLRYIIRAFMARAGGNARGRVVVGSNLKAKAMQNKMWKDLEAVVTLLSDTDDYKLPGSATELMNIAVEKGWLVQADITELKARLAADT